MISNTVMKWSKFLYAVTRIQNVLVQIFECNTIIKVLNLLLQLMNACTQLELMLSGKSNLTGILSFNSDIKTKKNSINYV
jgi:hypothetical protein